jgi:class 3 adenylate cyclase/pimeloyl-ACP methyl ester carboxylesterase
VCDDRAVQAPDTRYARSGDLRLAYQQWGAGPPLLIVPALLSNMEVSWEHEYLVRIFDLLGRHVTVAQFDKRGIGLSDRPEQPPTLDERIGDIVTVMDALGWERASLLGVSEGGVMAQLFAANCPERVDKLVLHNTWASPRYTPLVRDRREEGDPPIGRNAELWSRFESLCEGWPECVQEFVDWFMPGQSDNVSFVRWVGRFMRLSASPRDFRRQIESIFGLDAGDAPERITQPTLVVHVKGDLVLNVAGGRALAAIVPDAQYLEISGTDHFSWVQPNFREICDPMIEFVTGMPVSRVATRRFATVLFTDIVGSTRHAASVGDAAWHELHDEHDRLARKIVDQHGGRVVKSTGDGLLVIFDVPSEGVACGAALCTELRNLGVEVRGGLHAGEIEVHDDFDISGIAVNLAARVEQAATDGELWASSTVREMMLGGSATFLDRGDHQLKGIDGDWHLFAVDTAA